MDPLQKKVMAVLMQIATGTGRWQEVPNSREQAGLWTRRRYETPEGDILAVENSEGAQYLTAILREENSGHSGSVSIRLTEL